MAGTATQTPLHRRGIRNRLGLLVCLGSLATLLWACSTVSETEQPTLGAPQYPPTNPAQVVILHTAPDRPHIQLGKVTVDASTQPPPPVEKINAALQQGTAKLGGDAIVLVYDYTKTVGAVYTGAGWSGGEIDPIRDRVVIGIAVKYTDHQ
jgi:hypothetical protein